MDQSPQKTRYRVSHQEALQGPFDTEFIGAMVMTGVYPPAVLVQEEEAAEWAPFNTLGEFASCSLPAAPPADGPLAGNKPRPVKSVHTPVALCLMAGFGVMVFLSIRKEVTRHKDAPEKSRTAVDPVRSLYNPPPASSYAPSRFSHSPPSYTPSSSFSPPDSPYDPLTNSRTPSQQLDDFLDTHDSSSAAVDPTLLSTRDLGKHARSSGKSYDKPKDHDEAMTGSSDLDSTRLYRDASGRTYRVPNSAYSRLLSLQTDLNAKNAGIELDKGRVESLSRRLASDRILLDRTRSAEVDDYNEQVDKLNSMNSKLKRTIEDYNRDVDDYNAELERVGTLIY